MRNLHHLRALPLSAAGLDLVPVSLQTQASPLPLSKGGNCPLGYYSSGEYCLPDDRDTNREAIQKSGSTCPLGWHVSGK